MGNSRIVKACIALAFSLCVVNAMAADVCNEVRGHSGSKTKVSDSSGSTIIEKIPSSDYTYMWFNAGDNAMTYYEDGSFSVEWPGTADDVFLGGVDFTYAKVTRSEASAGTSSSSEEIHAPA